MSKPDQDPETVRPQKDSPELDSPKKDSPELGSPEPDRPKAIWAILQTLVPLYGLLRQCPMSERERKSRAVYLTPKIGSYVRTTAAAIEQHLDLFVGMPIKPEELRRIQDDADELNLLRANLISLLELCTDTYFEVQADAAIKTLLVHKWARQEAQRVFGPDRTTLLAREIALACTERYAARKGRKPKGTRDRDRKKMARRGG
jgi:hypothetical protein